MIGTLTLSVMGRPIESLEVGDAERRELERLINGAPRPQRLVGRARIVLSRAQRRSQEAAASKVGVSRPSVIR